MAKQITINYEGKEYTLEFTRKSIEFMEQQGFVIRDVDDKPMTMLRALFAGAFLAHHKFVKKEIIDSILAKLTKRTDLFEHLVDMYNEPLEALIDEPEESEGNLTWGASW